MKSNPVEKLKKWFERGKRTFPWRVSISPYRVWISEVMLQQTLASVVVPYFENWMARFPTIKDLAEAPIEPVIKTWEGLGYYSRARNLHSGAKMIVERHDGKIPDSKEELLKIKGIGDYTAAAILSFAFQQKEAAVDGNVKRVISRLYAMKEDIGKPKTHALIKSRVMDLLPDDKPWEAMEALIELGATVCKKKPACLECPLQNHCRAFQLGMERRLPVKTAAIRYQTLHRTVLVLRKGACILVKKVQEGSVMQDLHEFPYIETGENGLSPSETARHIEKQWNLTPRFKEKLPKVKHSFTRFRAELTPVVYEASGTFDGGDFFWVRLDKACRLPFSSGHKRILKHLAG